MNKFKENLKRYQKQIKILINIPMMELLAASTSNVKLQLLPP